MSDKSIPTHLNHKPIVISENYFKYDGLFAGDTDAIHLSVGKAQYGDGKDISVKVFRYIENKKIWNPRSEELPVHRVIDMSTVVLKSILLSKGVTLPSDGLIVKDVQGGELSEIVKHYKSNRDTMLPKLKELQNVLNYFLEKESQF